MQVAFKVNKTSLTFIRAPSTSGTIENKMLRNQRAKDFPTNQDGNHKPTPNITSSSRSWSEMRNPKIVHVSCAFGGKDQHSKVTTVRGLRDRRVRLSVPTAIQLYDLQDRLGLNPPSKVVDWLIIAAQHEIDKLPLLRLPSQGFNINGPHDEGLTTPFSQRSKNQREEPTEQASEKCNIKGNDLVSTQALLSNTTPYASNFYQWEAANAYLSQLGIRSSSQSEASVTPIPYFCPPGTMPSIFPSNNVVATQMAEFNSNERLALANPTIEFGDKFS